MLARGICHSWATLIVYPTGVLLQHEASMVYFDHFNCMSAPAFRFPFQIRINHIFNRNNIKDFYNFYFIA